MVMSLKHFVNHITLIVDENTNKLTNHEHHVTHVIAQHVVFAMKFDEPIDEETFPK